MKNYLVIGLVLISFLAKAQEEASVEKNLYGVQLGIVSTSFYYETKLDRKITLRTEASLEYVSTTKEYNDPSIQDETISQFSPYLTLEPRWYYGLDRRKRLEKNIKNNSSNYISLRTSYAFNNAPLFKNGDFDIVPAFYIIPKFGIRRVFAKHFNYEFSGGVGYQYNVFSKTKGCDCEHNNTAVDLQIRIGYDF
jgi:hypothetical protein